MHDFDDFVKQVRNLHFAVILSSVAIAIALSHSDSVHEHASQQLRDALRLAETLTAERISDSITSGNERSKQQRNIKEFVESALDEYFQEKEFEFETVRVSSFVVNLGNQEEYGHVSNLGLLEEFYEARFDDPTYWFDSQLCLLSDGDRFFTSADDLELSSIRRVRYLPPPTLANFEKFLNRLLGIDELYVNPAFYGSYLKSGPVADRYQLNKDIYDYLSHLAGIEMSIVLKDIKLTNDESRGVLKTAQGHAEDDPIAYESYNFEFDTWTLEIRASAIGDTENEGDRRSLTFDFELPVMFQRKDPSFIADVLQSKQFDPNYYSQYLLGARSFEQLLPELSEATENLRSVTPEDLEKYLAEQARMSQAPINLFGFQIRRDLLEVWGILLLLSANLYFCIHYRILAATLSQSDSVNFPWVGLYRDRISTFVFQITILLPVGICLFLAFTSGWNSPLFALKCIWVVVALTLWVWTEVLYVRSRRKNQPAT